MFSNAPHRLARKINLRRDELHESPTKPRHRMGYAGGMLAHNPNLAAGLPDFGDLLKQ
jgi:hypothetical protein